MSVASAGSERRWCQAPHWSVQEWQGFFEDHGNGARPEAGGKQARACRDFLAPAVEIGRPQDVNDERIVSWAALDFENFFYRVRVERVGAEAVDSFGRDCNQLTCAQQRCGPGNVGGIQNFSLIHFQANFLSRARMLRL